LKCEQLADYLHSLELPTTW